MGLSCDANKSMQTSLGLPIKMNICSIRLPGWNSSFAYISNYWKQINYLDLLGEHKTWSFCVYHFKWLSIWNNAKPMATSNLLSSIGNMVPRALPSFLLTRIIVCALCCVCVLCLFQWFKTCFHPETFLVDGITLKERREWENDRMKLDTNFNICIPLYQRHRVYA